MTAVPVIENHGYLCAAMAEVMANDPDLPNDELGKAFARLLAHGSYERWLFTEIRRRHPDVTFFWSVEEQDVCLLGICLKGTAS